MFWFNEKTGKLFCYLIILKNWVQISTKTLEGWVIFFSDIDECYLNNTGCHVNATCINTDGSFKCLCKDGFDGNGTTCHGMYFSLSFSMFTFGLSLHLVPYKFANDGACIKLGLCRVKSPLLNILD